MDLSPRIGYQLEKKSGYFSNIFKNRQHSLEHIFEIIRIQAFSGQILPFQVFERLCFKFKSPLQPLYHGVCLYSQAFGLHYICEPQYAKFRLVIITIAYFKFFINLPQRSSLLSNIRVIHNKAQIWVQLLLGGYPTNVVIWSAPYYKNSFFKKAQN